LIKRGVIIMILGFTVKNYKVFKDETTISFLASNYDKTTQELESIVEFPEKKLRILKSAVIYGPNASGKTKLFEAIGFMRHFIINSSKESQQGESIDVQPFLLSEMTEKEPSEFEMVFLYKNVTYRYGFEVTDQKVLAEWLFFKTSSKEIQVFYRDTVENTCEIHKKHFKKGAMLHKENMVRDNALMLSVASQFNDDLCSEVLSWFRSKLSVISGLREEGYQGFSMMKINQKDAHNRMMHLVQGSDLCIQDIRSNELKVEDIPDSLPVELREQMINEIKNENITYFSETITTHNKYDINNKIIGSVDLLLDEDESQGTQKFFYLSGPILDTLETGSTIFIDEFDARMHPNLIVNLFSLFINPEYNKQGAQLIITTHNSTLLRENMLRKDQIWFVEKDKFEASHLYPLSDFKSTKVRKGENFESNYLKGKYGAIPYINFYHKISQDPCKEK